MLKIGVIQASSQSSKNSQLYEAVLSNSKDAEVINFGCFKDENKIYSYIDISIEIGLLLASKSIDFIVTGCSSGQGMMLACNNMPGVICGYVPTPQDSYLFGKINAGNAVSLSLGLNYGWAGEINLNYTLEALFLEPFGTGYPPKDAERKMEDTRLLKNIEFLSHIPMIELLNKLSHETIINLLQRKNVTDYILKNGTNRYIIDWLQSKIFEIEDGRGM